MRSSNSSSLIALLVKQPHIIHECAGHGGTSGLRAGMVTERALRNVRHSSDLNFGQYPFRGSRADPRLLHFVDPCVSRRLHLKGFQIYPEQLEPWTYEYIANPLQFVSDISTDELGRST
jgi:hypothetical protein